MEEYFFEAFDGMVRLGPGSEASTLKALSYIDKEHSIRILDVGCGVGTHTFLMAEAIPNAHIVAIDNNPDYINKVNSQAKTLALSDRVKGICMSMFDMTFEDGSFDYIFAEGSIYIAGFTKGLSDWKRLLKNGGLLMCSEISWITENPSTSAKNFWLEAYPQMDKVSNKIEQAERLGYTPVDSFILPQEAWTTNYYMPLQANLDKMKLKYTANDTANEVINMIQQEIDLYHESGNDYSYVFYILRNEGAANS